MDAFILKLTENTRFSDDELFEFCSANKELRIERDDQGNLIIMSPSGSNTGRINLKILAQFSNWVYENETLGEGFDSSSGFLLPDGSMRAPDAAWVSKSKWDQLSQVEKDKFAPITPDFIIELKAPSDSLPTLQNKMNEWIANGVQLGWLIDPELKKAFIYKPSLPLKEVDSFDSFLDGENVLPGFRLYLSKLT
jgi:Uma2 family endonuclease